MSSSMSSLLLVLIPFFPNKGRRKKGIKNVNPFKGFSKCSITCCFYGQFSVCSKFEV